MQTTLFDEPIDVFELPSTPGADLTLDPHLFSPADAERLFHELHATSAWRHDTIHRYGRQMPVPRLTAWFGQRKFSYTYSGIRMDPTPWTEPMLEVKAAVEAATGVQFNSALANLYRDGQDSVAWHADDETELGPRPIIASVSFGATRPFQLRRHDDHSTRLSIPLTPGSLLVMGGATQHHWQHRIAKTAKPTAPRINLTFRQIQLT